MPLWLYALSLFFLRVSRWGWDDDIGLWGRASKGLGPAPIGMGKVAIMLKDAVDFFLSVGSNIKRVWAP